MLSLKKWLSVCCQEKQKQQLLTTVFSAAFFLNIKQGKFFKYSKRQWSIIILSNTVVIFLLSTERWKFGIWNSHMHLRGEKTAITDWRKWWKWCKWRKAVWFVKLLPLEAVMELHSSGEEPKQWDHENQFYTEALWRKDACLKQRRCSSSRLTPVQGSSASFLI